MLHLEAPAIKFRPYSGVIPDRLYRADWAGLSTFDLNHPSNAHHKFGLIYFTTTMSAAGEYAQGRLVWEEREGKDVALYECLPEDPLRLAEFNKEDCVYELSAGLDVGGPVERYHVAIELLRQSGFNGFVNLHFAEVALFREVAVRIDRISAFPR